MKVGDLVRLDTGPHPIRTSERVHVEDGAIGLIVARMVDDWDDELLEVHFVGSRIVFGLDSEDLEIVNEGG